MYVSLSSQGFQMSYLNISDQKSPLQMHWWPKCAKVATFMSWKLLWMLFHRTSMLSIHALVFVYNQFDSLQNMLLIRRRVLKHSTFDTSYLFNALCTCFLTIALLWTLEYNLRSINSSIKHCFIVGACPAYMHFFLNNLIVG